MIYALWTWAAYWGRKIVESWVFWVAVAILVVVIVENA